VTGRQHTDGKTRRSLVELVGGGDPGRLDGDKIILYTDGVLDYPNPAGEIFGKQRFCDALQKHGCQSVGPLMHSVQMTIKDFAGPASSADDLSLMVVEYV